MKGRDGNKKQQAGPDTSDFLRAKPQANKAVSSTPASDGGAMVKIPLSRPRWLVPPLSWLLPFSEFRRVRLDPIGVSVLGLCDGNNSVETIIEEFATANKLSFREAQLPVTKFLQQMSQRGLVVLVGFRKEAIRQ